MNQALAVLEQRGFLQQCTDRQALQAAMDAGPVTFYVGLDPTGPSLHAGHLVPLFAMVHLARAGHNPIALIGAGTARIGDPSGKTEMRRMLSIEDIARNARSIQRQVERFLETQGTRASIVNNADWLADLKYIEFLRDIGRHFSVNRMLSFETYRKRLETGLSFIEFNYQLLQSYDFAVLNQQYNCRLQIGGDDQWGNIVSGADLIRRMYATDAWGLTFPLVTRADGQKMGKTEQGAVFLDPAMVSPYEFFQYWRNVPDADVRKFLYLYTFVDAAEVEELGNLRDQQINRAKERLALELTRMVHGQAEADTSLQAARAAFGANGGAVAGAEARSAIPETSVALSAIRDGMTAVELFSLTDLCSSKAEARRLITQKGARINDRVVESIDEAVTAESFAGDELLLRAGRKRHFRVRLVRDR
ncbi:MAG: tyrosine--tRNA ligase [Spirochaetaceae bacterium]|nr:MAG: tyrosine--tRNA ligase [Spirochaetaceae bacterium]